MGRKMGPISTGLVESLNQMAMPPTHVASWPPRRTVQNMWPSWRQAAKAVKNDDRS